jgi:hypothetical protein
MPSYLSPERARLLRLITLAVYGLALGWASVAHAEGEVLRSSPVLESEHSEQCPTLHDDAVCGMSFHVELATSVPDGPFPEAGGAGWDPETRPAPGAPTPPSLARGPPSR